MHSKVWSCIFVDGLLFVTEDSFTIKRIIVSHCETVFAKFFVFKNHTLGLMG